MNDLENRIPQNLDVKETYPEKTNPCFSNVLSKVLLRPTICAAFLPVVISDYYVN